jgi:hypothetical protein
MISNMIGTDKTNETNANNLCKSCGLCCTGHLFVWAKLRPAELDSAEAMGMTVFRSDPSQRGFSQPCPLWHDQCTIYDSLHYPHVCRAYKCKLLKEVLGANTSLSNALTVVKQAKELIREVELLLPISPSTNFRERLVAHLEYLEASTGQENTEAEFRLKADALLTFYEQVFGVDDLVEKADE